MSTLLAPLGASFALHLLLKTTLLLALAGAVALLLRRASAAARHLVWTLAVAGLLALPLVSLLLPAWTVPVEAPLLGAVEGAPAVAPAALPAGTPAAAAQGEIPAQAFAPAGPPPAGWTAEAPAAAAPWTLLSTGEWLLAGWALGAALLLLRLAAGWWGVRRLARQAEPVADPEWTWLLKDLCWILDVQRPVRLLRSRSSTMPVTWGTLRPTVLLPADADAWPAGRRRVVLLHEMAHVARRDCLVQALADLACALYWFNPLSWYAARQLRAERERACDDQVLAAGARASDYAGHLLEVARAFRPVGMAGAAAIAMARPSQLEGRLLAVLDSARSRRTPGRRARRVGAAATALLLLPIATLRAGAAPVKEEATPELPALRVSAPAPRAQAQARADFHWRGRIAPGRSLAIRGVNGAVIAGPASGAEAEVRAVKRAGRRGSPEEVQVRLVEHGGGVLVCALYPSRGERPNECRPDGGEVNTRGNDTEVEFTVLVPQGVRFEGRTVNGAVRAESLRGDVEAATVNGEIRVSTTGVAEAVTVNGAIHASLGSARWPEGLRFRTVNGAIDVTLPADASAEVRAKTLNGSISADFPLTLRRSEVVGRSAHGTVGRGGPELSLETVNGAIRVQRAGGGRGEAAAAHAEVEVQVDAVASVTVEDTPHRRRARAGSAHGKGKWKLDARSPETRALLADPDAGVRRVAAWSLGDGGDRAAVAPLGGVLREDRDAEVREMAAWALGEIGSADAVAPLRDAARRDPSREVRATAVWALGEIGHETAVPALVAALRDGDAGVRRTAAWALGEIGDASAAEPLRAALRDADPGVRKTALWALSNLPGEVARPAVAGATRSEDPELRRLALDVMAGSPWPMPWPWPMPRPRPTP